MSVLSDILALGRFVAGHAPWPRVEVSAAVWQSAIEAMAAGLPVIATAVAGVPEMVLDGKTGFLVAEKDFPALADRMGRLLDDENLAQEMGRAGRAHCEELFDVRRTSASLLEILQFHGTVSV